MGSGFGLKCFILMVVALSIGIGTEVSGLNCAICSASFQGDFRYKDKDCNTTLPCNNIQDFELARAELISGGRKKTSGGSTTMPSVNMSTGNTSNAREGDDTQSRFFTDHLEKWRPTRDWKNHTFVCKRVETTISNNGADGKNGNKVLDDPKIYLVQSCGVHFSSTDSDTKLLKSEKQCEPKTASSKSQIITCECNKDKDGGKPCNGAGPLLIQRALVIIGTGWILLTSSGFFKFY